jgi:hypothetical protein
MVNIISGVGTYLGTVSSTHVSPACQTLDVHREWILFGVMSKVGEHDETRKYIL